MNMNFDVPYEDMVRGARSGSSSGRRLGSVYASSSYGSRTEYFCTSSFFGRCICGAI
ncbi:hypothetical protein Taro_002547, partial [Colocasia esculenta]|nr:hypothetical protein [Colocasia esculenta]